MNVKMSYQEAKAKISEIAKPFGAYVVRTQCGVRLDGRRTLTLHGIEVNSKVLTIKCSEFPQPVIDKIHEELELDYLEWENFQKEKRITVETARVQLRPIFPKYYEATELYRYYDVTTYDKERSDWINNSEVGVYLREHMNQKYGKVKVMWAVRIILPVELSQYQKGGNADDTVCIAAKRPD